MNHSCMHISISQLSLGSSPNTPATILSAGIIKGNSLLFVYMFVDIYLNIILELTKMNSVYKYFLMNKLK